MTAPRFYTGSHQPHWLWSPAADFPLFVSHRALSRVKNLRPSTHGWALDSGGFTELSKYGEWRTTPGEYAEATARYDGEIGRLEWAAPQDWMCEPFIIGGGGLLNAPGTGLSVAEHQRRTVANFLELREIWPRYSDSPCPFMPVLQGWVLEDYRRCEQMYREAGVRLEDYPVTGLGSVCRRQATAEIGAIAAEFAPRLAVHGFGVKAAGLVGYGHLLTSADSLAWSYAARRSEPLPGHRHMNCANCLEWARNWRSRLLDGYQAAQDRGHQGDLFERERAA